MQGEEKERERRGGEIDGKEPYVYFRMALAYAVMEGNSTCSF